MTRIGSGAPCVIDGCDTTTKGRSMCERHYYKQYRAKNRDKLIAKQRRYVENNKEKVRFLRHKQSRTPKNRFVSSKYRAQRRGLSWSLSFEQYLKLINTPCNYCQNKLGVCHAGVGLDRIDNNRGYESDNIISCCGVCNQTRMNAFTVEETEIMISAVLEHRRKQQ